MGFLYRESVGIGLGACCVRFIAMKRDVRSLVAHLLWEHRVASSGEAESPKLEIPSSMLEVPSSKLEVPSLKLQAESSNI